MSYIRLTLTFSTYHPVLARISDLSKDGRPPQDVDVLVWAVVKTAKVVPGATCLTQALTLRYLMAQSGLSATIRIGVAPQSDGSIDAHAWVVRDEKVLIGAFSERVERFTPIVDL